MRACALFTAIRKDEGHRKPDHRRYILGRQQSQSRAPEISLRRRNTLRSAMDLELQCVARALSDFEAKYNGTSDRTHTAAIDDSSVERQQSRQALRYASPHDIDDVYRAGQEAPLYPNPGTPPVKDSDRARTVEYAPKASFSDAVQATVASLGAATASSTLGDSAMDREMQRAKLNLAHSKVCCLTRS